MVTSPALYLALEGARPLGRGMRFSLARATELHMGRGKVRSASVDGTVIALEVPDPRMSGKHARFVRRGVGWVLEDLGSTNGTFLDGAVVTSRAFHKVARLLLGTTGFVFDPDAPAPDGTPAVLDADTTDLRSLRPDVDAELCARDALGGDVHDIAPLKERTMDLGLLVSAMLPRLAGTRAPAIRLHHDLVQAMLAHPWGKGEAELEHMIAGALAATNEATLRVEHVARALQEMRRSDEPAPRPEAAPREADAKLREELVLFLTETEGNVSEVARRMKRTRMQIHRWMKRWDIDVESYRR